MWKRSYASLPAGSAKAEALTGESQPMAEHVGREKSIAAACLHLALACCNKRRTRRAGLPPGAQLIS